MTRSGGHTACDGLTASLPERKTTPRTSQSDRRHRARVNGPSIGRLTTVLVEKRPRVTPGREPRRRRARETRERSDPRYSGSAALSAYRPDPTRLRPASFWRRSTRESTTIRDNERLFGPSLIAHTCTLQVNVDVPLLSRRRIYVRAMTNNGDDVIRIHFLSNNIFDSY